MKLRDKLGLCEWFHYEDYAAVERAVAALQESGVRHLRTGISWADFHRPNGPAWYAWQMDALRDFDVLLSIWHTPPSIAEGERCAGPPRRLEDYADFIGEIIDRFGERFESLELWNEPNNRYKWDFVNYDPKWEKFGRMIAAAARVAKRRGRRTVLGGIIPVDRTWLELMHSSSALEDIDVIAIHGFPEMWWSDAPNWDWHSHWRGWADKVEQIAPACAGRPVWITETGLATWNLKEGHEDRFDLQSRMLREAAAAPAERVYWYCLYDLAPHRTAIEGFHVDENEYHMGLIRADGTPKPAYYGLQQLLAGQQQEGQ